MDELKICKKCKIEKNKSEFNKVGSRKYPEQLRGECKECRKVYNKNNYQERKEKGYYKKE